MNNIVNRLRAYAIFAAGAIIFMAAVWVGIYFVASQFGHEILGMILVVVWITICYGVTLGILLIFHKRSQRSHEDRGGGGGVGSY